MEKHLSFLQVTQVTAMGTSDKVNVVGAAAVLCVGGSHELPYADHNWWGRNIPSGQQPWVIHAGTSPEGLWTSVSRTGAWILRNSATGKWVSGKEWLKERVIHVLHLVCHSPRWKNLGRLNVTYSKTKETWNSGVARIDVRLNFCLKVCVLLFLNTRIHDQMFVLISNKLSKIPLLETVLPAAVTPQRSLD